MSRINLVDPADATGDAQAALGQIKAAFGMTPNMFRAAANSPAALKSLSAAWMKRKSDISMDPAPARVQP